MALISTTALSHDFWLQPEQFSVGANRPILMSLFVGHGVDRQLWQADIKRLVSARVFGPSGVISVKSQFRQGGVGQAVFPTAGTYLIALETGHAVSELPAIRFNDYLQKEGLITAIARRTAQGETTKSGREIYSRRAKALIRVGTERQSSAAYITSPLGLTLEIVPDQNPYVAPINQALGFRIFYKGRPLPGATVKLTDLAEDAEPKAELRSDSNGRVRFNILRRGNWQLNVVWTEALIGNRIADFDTTFSSLTFGF